MGIVVFIIHAAIKFHTPSGIGIVLLTYEPNKVEAGQKKVKETIPKVTKDFLSCVDAKERIIVNEKYHEQTVVIRKQLPTSFKRKLQDLLRSNADVFTWTYADMTGISRTTMVGGKPFNTEHKQMSTSTLSRLSKRSVDWLRNETKQPAKKWTNLRRQESYEKSNNRHG
nr:reverse transcriptase domain-containing protein [Tanacetum cinerariifolium]